MVSDVTANVRAPAVRPDDLRMLDPVERKATRMAWEDADLVDIATETGLSWQRIREAVALQAKWKREPPPPGWDPDPQPEPDPDPLGEVGDLSTPLPVRAPVPDAEPAPEPPAPTERQQTATRMREVAAGLEAQAQLLGEAQTDAERDAELEQLVQRRPAHRPVPISFGGVDLAQMVRAAERGDDAHARSLAIRIRRLADDLSAYMALRTEVDLAHQRIDTLQTEVESLKRLAHRGKQRTAQAEHAPVKAPFKEFPEDLRYSPAVRTWARRNGHDVKARGRIADHVVEAYLRASVR